MFEPVEEFRAEDLLQTPQLVHMVKRETPLAIRAALEENKTFATIFEVNASGMFIDIPKSYWIDALEQCINYNLEEEKFEDCIELKKIPTNVWGGVLVGVIDPSEGPIKLKPCITNRDFSSNKPSPDPNVIMFPVVSAVFEKSMVAQSPTIAWK